MPFHQTSALGKRQVLQALLLSRRKQSSNAACPARTYQLSTVAHSAYSAGQAHSVCLVPLRQPHRFPVIISLYSTRPFPGVALPVLQEAIAFLGFLQ